MGRPAEYSAHIAVAGLLGFVGLNGDELGVTGWGLVGLVTAPAAVLGFAARRIDYGMHAVTTEWVWLPAVLGVGLLWATTGVYDGYWNVFTGGNCRDFHCLPNMFVTAPALGCVGYSIGAFAGRLGRPKPAVT